MEYKKHIKDSDQSSIWSYFLCCKEGTTAKCKQCNLVLKTSGGSTKGLHTHLRAKHNKSVLKRALINEESAIIVAPNEKNITDFFTKKVDDTLPAVLTRMTAKDGLPFSIFITSNDMRSLLISKGYADLPKSATTIRNMVMRYGEKIRANIKQELKSLKDSGERFSVSFDEWTSYSNKRYMNVSIFSTKNQWNLGLVRIVESLTSEVCIRVLTQRLEMFGITLSTDIVAVVTDGPNVMLKVGKTLNVEHQNCLAHTIHLAVCDVLYKKYEKQDIEGICNDEDEYEDLHCSDSGLAIEIECAQELTDDHNIHDLIKKVRLIVLSFKRSPTKNDAVLQKYVLEEHGKELALLLDCKTRWNSLLTMIERFILLKSCIQKAIIDIKLAQTLCDAEFDLLNDIINILLPLKLTVEALGRADANLCTADGALRFLFKELHNKNTTLANKMSNALETRLEKRRNEFSGVLYHLQNPRADQPQHLGIPHFLDKPNKKVILKQITSLLQRFEVSTADNGVEDNEIQVQEMDSSHLSLKEVLELELTQSMTSMDPLKVTNIHKVIKTELNMIEVGKRGYYLKKVYNYLITIPPTSIEPERAFSAASYLGNKIRSRLSAETLDILVFLRFYFRK